MTAGWAIEDCVLQYINGTDRHVPEASEICSLTLEGTASGDPEDLLSAADDLGIAFSPYPVSVRLVLLDPGTGTFPRIELQAETQFGEVAAVPIAALSAGHVVLGATWYPIDPDEREELSELLRSLKVEGPDVTEFHALLRLKQSASAGGRVVDRTSAETLSTTAFVKSGRSMPEGINADLYPYQLEGWAWLRFLIGQRVGALLADEMGLGKTLQVISALVDPDDTGPVRPVLVVAPGSLLENWCREFAKFAPDISVGKHQGRLRTGRPADLQQYDVVVTSYDTIIRDLSLLMMINWRVIVADEAQNIKNPEALRSQSLKQLPREVALAMTGTPIENRLEDLWSIMDFAVPDYLGSREQFQERYGDDLDGARELEPVVSPLMLRRRVATVAQDLPARIDMPQVLELTEEEALSYDDVRERILEEYGPAASLVSLTSLRQFCAHPALLGVDGVPSAEFTKMIRLREILEEILMRREKALVFTSYTRMADWIAEMVRDEFGMFSACLDGRLAIDDRQPLIDRFSEIADGAVLVLNPRAGGSGLNITAANHVIHYNLEWNPALEDQASARSHRRGQELPVTVHRLFFADTVEDVVNDRIERKRTLSEAAVVGVEGKQEDLDDILSALRRSPVRKSAR